MNHTWPQFKTYEGAALRRISMPIGGIGTGTIGLGGRGNLRDFELVNRPAKGFNPPNTFLALRTECEEGVFCRALEGPIPLEDYEGSSGSEVPNHGLPRFQGAKFHAAYPLAEVELMDEACPVLVSIEAFNPMEPGNIADSSYPCALLKVRLQNTSPRAIRASVLASMGNFIGTDGTQGKPEGSRNTFRRGTNWQGVLLDSESVDPGSPYFGTTLLAGVEDGAQFSHRTHWLSRSWGDSLLELWDDFASDGNLVQPEGDTVPTCSLCASLNLAPGATRTVTFVITWHFPNRLSWSPDSAFQILPAGSPGGSNAMGFPIVGNHYCTLWSDASEVMEALAPRLEELEAKTVGFVRALYTSSLPAPVLEAAAFNLSTLRTNTVFRTPDGRFFGWEGIHDRAGSCFGNCTHVWNYEQATPFLFQDMARSFRATEFLLATDEVGLMSFRVGLPLEDGGRNCKVAAADGQMGCLMKLYREWKLSGDDEWLRSLWPAAKRTLEFCWLPGGWDADHDGVMEGCQHNTMDVEYYGPNPQMGTWYLGALISAAAMATHMGDQEFAARCHNLAAQGRRALESELWNGEYFEHKIVPPPPDQVVLRGLRSGMGAANLTDPELQLGAGCLVDQLVGCYMAEVLGLEPLLDQDKVRTTLHSILRHNRREGERFNHMRSYALGQERAVLMASYPRGNRPARPFPYYNEVMTGFEHALAAHLLYLGEEAAGLQVIEDIRDRYDGVKRNPFDEAECGRHYARAMASWAHVLALTGFDWDGRTGTMKFASSSVITRWFWSNGNAWGVCKQTPVPGGLALDLEVHFGSLPLQHLKVGTSSFTLEQLTRTELGWNVAVAHTS